MKLVKLFLVCFIGLSLLGCVKTKLTMSAPPDIDFSSLKTIPYQAGLYISEDLKLLIYEKRTSPFDTLQYPIGRKTISIFKQNLPKVFKKVVVVDSKKPGPDIDLVIVPSVIKFDSVIPYPSWNPHMATIVYRVEVYDRNEEKIFVQTATGKAQMSKGLLTGFSGTQFNADVAQKAMKNGATQIMEGLMEAEELRKPLD